MGVKGPNEGECSCKTPCVATVFDSILQESVCYCKTCGKAYIRESFLYSPIFKGIKTEHTESL
jgi:hypothetical protein